MKKLLLLFALPLGLHASAAIHGHTYLRHMHHYQLHTGPMRSITHNHNQAAPFLNGTLQVTGFYEQRLSNADAGRFIGTQPTNTTYTLAHINTSDAVSSQQADVVNNYFIHADPTASNSLSAKLDARPSAKCYGTLLSYEQSVPLFSSWYIGAHIPVIDSRTTMHLKQVESAVHVPGDLLQYFAGFYHSDTAARAQAKLTTNKFDVHELQVGGAGQIDFWIRKKLVSTNRGSIDIGLHATAPLTHPIGSDFLYAPTLGSNGHWHIGIQSHAHLELWKHPHNMMSFHVKGRLAYGFSADETRVLGISNALTIYPFGHYALFTNKSAAANAALEPGANILKRTFSVTPGISYELSSSFVWKGCQLEVHAGHTLEGADAESAGSWQWSEGTYALAGHKYDTTKTFAEQAAVANTTVTLTDAVGATHTYLQRSDLDITKALLPGRSSHCVWTELQYGTTLGVLPLRLHVGLAATVGASSWHAAPLSTWIHAQLSF